jgi:hypothetical protein
MKSCPLVGAGPRQATFFPKEKFSMAHSAAILKRRITPHLA